MSTPELPINQLFGLAEVYETALHQALIREGVTDNPAQFCLANEVVWKPTLNVKLGVVSIVITRITPRPPELKPS